MLKRSTLLRSAVFLLVAAALGPLICAGQSVPPASPTTPQPGTPTTLPATFRTYDTRYYVIYSDLPKDGIREATVRMTRMAEEYHARTADFSGNIMQKMPFYLFSSANDYYAAGGYPGSAGFFNGRELMAIAGHTLNGATWHVVQHEGFHQFAAAVINGDLPVWVNEGLAEYFGEAVFTGDSFVSGVIPAWRMQRLRSELDAGKLLPVDSMIHMSHARWNANLQITNYDLAWSMVQFLAHGENGRYQRAFSHYMWLLAQNTAPADAWIKSFGDTRGFQDRWQLYWHSLPEEPTGDLYAKAVVASFTSYLARAAAEHQSFDSFDQFVALAGDGKLLTAQEDWLPPSLLRQAMKNANAMQDLGDTFQLRGTAPHQEIFCQRKDGARLRGYFNQNDWHPTQVMVDFTPAPKP